MNRKIIIAMVLLLVVAALVVSVAAIKAEEGQMLDESAFYPANTSATLQARLIYPNGTLYSTLMNNDQPNMNVGKTVYFTTINEGVTITERIFVHRKSSVRISEDGKIIMQYSQFRNSPTLQLYYGYNTGPLSPWAQFYSVGDCDVICRTVHADFATRNVWITYTNETAINNIVNSGLIPAYGALP